MEICKRIPDIYDLDNFNSTDKNDELDVVIYFKEHMIDKIYFNEIDVTSYHKGNMIINILDILKKSKNNSLTKIYKKYKYKRLSAYMRLKTNYNHFSLWGSGSRAQQFIEDKTFFNNIYSECLVFFILVKSFNSGDFIKIKIKELEPSSSNISFSPLIRDTQTDTIPIFNVSLYDIPTYFEILYGALQFENKIIDTFDKKSNIPKKIYIPVQFPDGVGEIECDMFIRYKSGYTCYIKKYILPNGEIINIKNVNTCNFCKDYSKIYDISLQSKYKMYCYHEFIAWGILFKNYYAGYFPSKLNNNAEIKVKDLDIFTNISKKFTFKIYYKD
jgi:hypothetical protein